MWLKSDILHQDLSTSYRFLKEGGKHKLWSGVLGTFRLSRDRCLLTSPWLSVRLRVDEFSWNWYWGLYGILPRNSRFAESRKKMLATLHENKSVCPVVCNNVGSATKRKMHCCATLGMITAFITFLTATCLRGVPMTTLVTWTLRNLLLRTLPILFHLIL
jgi:hypothetical protein